MCNEALCEVLSFARIPESEMLGEGCCGWSRSWSEDGSGKRKSIIYTFMRWHSRINTWEYDGQGHVGFGFGEMWWKRF